MVFARNEDLLEIQVWYFLINDSLGEIDSVAMRFLLRWVIGATWEGTGIDDAITFHCPVWMSWSGNDLMVKNLYVAIIGLLKQYKVTLG